MSPEERIRASYQHACLQYVSDKRMSNASLRQRLAIKESNYPMVSKIIRDAIDANLIKQFGDGVGSRKDATYFPFESRSTSERFKVANTTLLQSKNGSSMH